MVLHFDFIDVNITDSMIVNKSVTVRESDANSQCYGDVLTVIKSCLKYETCRFPEINVQYSSDIKSSAIIGPGICSSNCIMENSKGRHCPIPYSVEYSRGVYSCWDNRQGELCGQCIEGHSVAINSPYLACVPCNDTMTVLKGWGSLVVLEFIPVTAMVAVIAVLNVNLNQGSLKAYIFFCQILTIPFPSVSYPSWFVIAYNYNLRITNIQLIVFAIWNLGFINFGSCFNFLPTFCISDETCYTNFSVGFNDDYLSVICISCYTTALGAIFFWYIIAFFPFILLFLLYFCVLAYNRGFYCFVCVMRPVHRLLARFWRKFNVQPSLPHTIASLYTLCYTQLAATSLKLLHFTTYDNQLRFFYDGSRKYFSGWHGAACTVALIVLIVFIIVPAVYLFVYPFKWFQKCLNKVKIRKDLLVSVTDVFTAPYSDGTQNTWDYRYYASSHFILQLLVMVLYYIPSPICIILLQVCFCSLFLISLAVFRPYKRKIHVFVEATLLLMLVIYSLCVLYIIRGDKHTPLVMEFIISGVTSSPIYGGLFLISCCFSCVWCSKKCYKRQRVRRRQQPQEIVAQAENNNEDSCTEGEFEPYDALLADRIVNPDWYNRK